MSLIYNLHSKVGCFSARDHR